jgi:hypothetical protein
MKSLIAVVVLASFVSSAQASKEGILPFSNFRIESDGIGKSGKVIVEGKQGKDDRLISLKVTAFGKQYVIPKDRLAELKGLAANGVRLSYDHGYVETGGRTIYVQFQMGFTSSTRERALITLTEDGTIRIERN